MNRARWSPLLALVLTALARPQTQSVIYTFGGTSASSLIAGANPFGGLVFDKAGHAFGTTLQGGTGNCRFPYTVGCGTVFELSPATEGGTTWVQKVIYSFQGVNDGAYPQSQLVLDEEGNLYGTTYNGGGDGCVVAGCGTVFELRRSGGQWIESVLYRFTDVANGANPAASLVLDREGNLYGTTVYGGNQICNADGPGCGVVFELKRPTLASASSWTEIVLHAFDQDDGAYPLSALTIDAQGNVYGNTSSGGNGSGLIFELQPNGNGWSEKILYNFPGEMGGGSPVGQLLLNESGDLYGVTSGGGVNGVGSVFALIRASDSWTLQYLHSFDGYDGWFPANGVVADPKGNLYGSTPQGGMGSCQYECGVVYSLNRSNDWAESVLYYFQGHSDGFDPYGAVTIHNDDLYGTTVAGGDPKCSALASRQGCGVVFKISRQFD